MLEPYEAFDMFCREYGFRDVAECVPEEVDLVRLHQALNDYEQYCKCQGCQEDQCAVSFDGTCERFRRAYP